MSKIVFFCIPASGHTNPTLGVVQELIARGSEVWYYSYEPMRAVIEATGAHFVACDAYDPQTKLTPKDGERIGKDIAFSIGLITDMTLALGDAIERDMLALGPDVIVADSVAYWGKLLAQKLGIPFVSSTTTFAFNRYSAKVMKQGGGGLFSMLKALPRVNKSLRRLREKGYPVKNVLSIIANDNETNTIVYTSPMFQPCAETFSERYVFVGPSMRPVTEPLARVEKPTVYISLGTVVNLRPAFYRNCIEAFRDSPYRVIMAVGEQTDPASLDPLPENFTVAQRVDQMAVLEAADVFVTHCGMNSVNEALYNAVPLVLFPQMPEQEGVANRVTQLGAGQPLKDDSPEELRRTVDTVLHDKKYRDAAGKVSDSFKNCGGASAAADAIENAARHGTVDRK